VVLIEVCETIQIIVSVDTEGDILIHSLTSGESLKQMHSDLENDSILQLRIHQLGMLMLLTQKQRLLIYT
jgi:hypothetical protein